MNQNRTKTIFIILLVIPLILILLSAWNVKRYYDSVTTSENKLYTTEPENAIQTNYFIQIDDASVVAGNLGFTLLDKNGDKVIDLKEGGNFLNRKCDFLNIQERQDFGLLVYSGIGCEE